MTHLYQILLYLLGFDSAFCSLREFLQKYLNKLSAIILITRIRFNHTYYTRIILHYGSHRHKNVTRSFISSVPVNGYPEQTKPSNSQISKLETDIGYF